MPQARIYQPAKNTMQSGTRNTGKWALDFEPCAKSIDSLMGWTGSADTSGQVRMKFPTKEAAVAFAEKKGLVFEVHEPQARRIQPKNYAARFRSALSG